MAKKVESVLGKPTETDRDRLDGFWRDIAGPGNYNISPRDRMDAWAVEQQILSDQRANDRMTKATWALVLATVVEVCVTVGQVAVALLHH